MTQSAITSALNGKAASSHSHSNYLPLTGGTLNNGSTQCPLIIRGAANNESSITYKYTGQDSGGHWVVGQGAGTKDINTFAFYKNGAGVLAKINSTGTFCLSRCMDVDMPSEDDAVIAFTGGNYPMYILKNSGGISIHPYKGHKIFQWTTGSTKIDSKLYAQGIYDLASSSTANIHIASDGSVRRVGSASKYKLDIKPLEEDSSYPYKLLNLQPKQWFDKGETERYAELLSKEYSGEEIDEEYREFAEAGSLDSYYGLIAEDLEKAGLSKFCTYGKADKDGKKELEGIMYDRFPILTIPILKDLVEYVKTTYPLIKDSIKDKDSLSKVSSIIDRMNSIDDSTMVNTTYKVDNTEK